MEISIYEKTNRKLHISSAAALEDATKGKHDWTINFATASRNDKDQSRGANRRNSIVLHRHASIIIVVHSLNVKPCSKL